MIWEFIFYRKKENEHKMVTILKCLKVYEMEKELNFLYSFRKDRYGQMVGYL